MSVVNLTHENFDAAVLHSERPVLIDFWASWCGPCRMQSPIMEELADEVGDSAAVVKVNVDEEPELAARFGVMSIPTIAVAHGGRIVAQRIGVTPRGTLLSMLGEVSTN